MQNEPLPWSRPGYCRIKLLKQLREDAIAFWATRQEKKRPGTCRP